MRLVGEPHDHPARLDRDAAHPLTRLDHHAACVRADELPRWSRRGAGDVAREGGLPGVAMVQVEHLTKIYEPRRRRFRGPHGPVRAVSDVELAAARGRTLAIVGESGGGKSTVAKVLSGLEVATSGSVALASA